MLHLGMTEMSYLDAWASLKTPQIENMTVSTFFITEFTMQK